jgi:glycosyltransferase involved in cell wall biosynthesis
VSVTTGLGHRDQSVTFAALEAMTRARLRRTALFSLYGDSNLDVFRLKPRGCKLIGTLHHPPRAWDPARRTAARFLDGAIVLYRRDLLFFEEILAGRRVEFARHGVDHLFFCPGQSQDGTEPRILFVGTYLRNTAMLSRVVQKLLTRYSDVVFDFLVPAIGCSDPKLLGLRAMPRITWHAELDDEALRSLYRQSRLMLLPMNDSGANNAILESLACGLPIVTTDVGGIRDYGGESVFPIVPNDDDDAMLAWVDRLLTDSRLRIQIGRTCRAFVERELAWDVIAGEHLRTLERILA